MHCTVRHGYRLETGTCHLKIDLFLLYQTTFIVIHIDTYIDEHVNILYFGGLNHLILLKKNDKNCDFRFLVKRRLFPNDLSRVHIPPYHRCTQFEKFLPISTF